jgi:hypothetical protein
MYGADRQFIRKETDKDREEKQKETADLFLSIPIHFSISQGIDDTGRHHHVDESTKT